MIRPHRWKVIVLILVKRSERPKRDPATSEGILCFIANPITPPEKTRRE